MLLVGVPIRVGIDSGTRSHCVETVGYAVERPSHLQAPLPNDVVWDEREGVSEILCVEGG